MTQIFQNKTGQVFDEEAAFSIYVCQLLGVSRKACFAGNGTKNTSKKHVTKKETLIVSKSTNQKQ